MGLWRDAENETQERSKRKATGYTENDIETAMDPQLEINLTKRFHASYKFGLSEYELLWSHLLGRLRREIDRGNHSLSKGWAPNGNRDARSPHEGFA